MENKSGITLIALIITIIIMLILVGVTVSFIANGGLITKAKQAGKQTQIEADKELLLFDIVVATETNGTISFNQFKQAVASDGFTISGESLPCTAISKNGNEFSVSLDGKVTYIGEGEVSSEPEDDELELLRKYFVGKQIMSLIDNDNPPSGSESIVAFLDGTGDASEVKGENLIAFDTDFDTDKNEMYIYITYSISNNQYIVTVISANTEDDAIATSVERYTGTRVKAGFVEYGDYNYYVSPNEGIVELYGLSEQGKAKDQNSQTISENPLNEIEYKGTMYTVTSIHNAAFSCCKSLELIALPSGITSIGRDAFYSCDNLVLTSLPSGLTNIGDSAFVGCDLSFTSLPSGLKSIGSNAFRNCTNLQLTSLPSGITVIEEGTFEECTNLALTSLPDGVTSIGNHAFYNCTNLSLTSLPNSITSIGDFAFSGCTNLALTSLPSNLTTIGSTAFLACYNLALQELPSGLTTIGYEAFYNCSHISLTTLPARITSIGYGAFTYCYGITQLDLRNCTNLSSSSEYYPWGLDPNIIIFE